MILGKYIAMLPFQKPLLIPVGLYIILSVAYVFAFPIGESPDEPGHLQCIEQVSIYNRIPIVQPKPVWGEYWSRSVSLSGRMCYHMPLYYLVGGYLQSAVAFITDTPTHFEFPPTNQKFLKNRAMFLHEDKTSFWHLPETPAVLSTRILSISLGAITIWGSYYISRRVFSEHPIVPILAATMVAGLPQFVYLSRSINNDVMATALAVGILMVLINVGHPKRFILAAVLSSLAIFTKITVSFVIVAIIVTWLLELFIYHTQRRQYVKNFMIAVLMWGATVLLIVLHPTLREHIGQGVSQFITILDEALAITYWQKVLRLTASSGWVRFGWMNIPAPQWHANAWWLGVLLTGWIGFVAAWYQRKTEHTRLILLIIGIWFVGVVSIYMAINLNRFQPQFRFMLASLPVLMMFSSAGILFLVEKVKWLDKQMMGILLVIFSALFLLGYNLWVILAIVGPIYGWA